jgi:hypothetical protein
MHAKRKKKVVGMLPDILKLLTRAIQEKRCIAIRYHGQTHIRVLEPHAIYTAENGEILMDAFQVRGYSSSGRPTPFWRPFRLKKINVVSLLKENFTTRGEEGFDPGKSKYKNGMYAIVDDRRRAFAIPPPVLTQTVSEEMGPHLPKNPYRR